MLQIFLEDTYIYIYNIYMYVYSFAIIIVIVLCFRSSISTLGACDQDRTY